MIPNAQQLAIQARKLDRLNARATQVVDAMRRGASLQLEFRYGAQRWRLTDGCEVDREAARLVIRNPKIVADGDVLFVGCLAQTFRHVETTQPQEPL
jgi:hypothetical protein